ncbi:MAG: aminotransferase class I/II-fold pyridoxal phosphate-dependent enzyme, partial [Acaryochloridaceae cyanobacterium RL_2_7]|nr:aminotransferase class I/II-fold pyridoxal phosphate-dependent enzyme [Acaryochloridaceae cyanobacterium RL_2_7]
DFAEQHLSCDLLVPGFNDYFRALNAYQVPINRQDVSVFDHDELSPMFIPRESQGTGSILNNPHNPSGKRIAQDYIQQCLETRELVVIDEAFLDFVVPQEQQSSIPLLETYPNLVILRSLTKFFSLPGLRIGYAIAHPDRLKRWQEWRDPWSVNSLAIAMGAACIRDIKFQERVWDWLPKARSHLYQQIQTIECLEPMAGIANFLLVKSRCSVTHLQSELLQQHKILIRDCLSFPELGDHYFRVAVLRRRQNEQLVQALRQVKA